jgi:TP901 family phage tail tape measure protein
MATKVGDLYFESGIKTAGFNRDAAKMESRIGQSTKKIQGMGGQMGKGLSSAFTSLGINPMVGGIAAVGAALGAVGKQAYDFSNQMNSALLEVKTISASVTEDYEGMKQKILDVSMLPIKDDAIELTQAFYQVVSAGHDGADGLMVLEAAAKAATGGVTETKTAADGLTTVLNAWGLEAERVNEVNDVMFTAVKLGKTTMGELSASISQVAPMASAMGVSFEEVFGAVASLTKQGVPTAQAMTQIRASMISLNDVLGDGWAETMTYQEALQAVADKAGGSQTKLKEMMGRVEGVNAVLAMTGDKAAGAAKDLDDMANSAGAANNAFETMADDTDIMWNQVSNKWKAQLNDIGGIIEKMSSGLADYLSAALTGADSLGDEFAEIGKEVDGFSERMKVLRNEGVGLFGSMMGATFSSDEKIQKIVDAEKAEVQQTKDNIAAIQEEFNRLQESGASDEQLNEFKENLKIRYDEMLEATEKEAEAAKRKVKKANIMNVATLGLGSSIADAIKANAKDAKDEVDSFREILGAVEGLSLPGEIKSGDSAEQAKATVEDQIRELKILLSSSKKELGEMRLFDSVATPEEIDAKEKLIKEFEKQLNILTGASKKADKDIEAGVNGSIKKLEEELKNLQDKTGTFSNPDQEAANIEEIKAKTLELKDAWSEVREHYAKSINMDNIEGMKPMESKRITAIDPKPIKDSLAPMKKLTKEEEKQLKAIKEKLDAEREIEMRREVQRENMSELADNLMIQVNAFDALSQIAGSFNKELGDSVKSMADMMYSSASLITNLSTGNWLGAVGSGVELITQMINSSRDNEREMEQAQIERTNRLIETQNKLMQMQTGEDWWKSATQEVDRLNAIIKESKDALDKLKWALPDLSFMDTLLQQDWLDYVAKHDGEVLDDWHHNRADEILDYVNQWTDAAEAIRELEAELWNETFGFSPDDITTNIVSGIMDGFELAQDGLGDFADGFQELMEKAALQALTKSLNQQYLDDIMDKFEEAMKSDGYISDDEMGVLQDEYRDAVIEMNEAAKNWAHVIGENTEEAEKAKDEGMKGDIQGITEKTAGQLEGRINSIQMNVIGLKEINQSQLQTLEAIRVNTSYNFHLEAMAVDMDNLRRTQSSMLEVIRESNQNTGVTI